MNKFEKNAKISNTNFAYDINAKFSRRKSYLVSICLWLPCQEKALGLLRPVRTWSRFDPHRCHTSIITSCELDRTKWWLRSCPHFDPVRTANLTRDNSYTRPNYRHVIASLLLCSPYINNVFVSCTVQQPINVFYKHMLQLTSSLATWLLHFRW